MTTPRDFDHLSAYLDHALSPRDHAALEARLTRDLELKAALADLRLNRRLLRALPAPKLPRHFTLTRAQAETARRPRFTLFPTLRLATAFATLLFIFVLVADLGGGYLGQRQAATAPQASNLAQSDGAAETAVEPPAAAAALAIPTETPLTKAADETATSTVDMFAASAPASSPAPAGGAAPLPTTVTAESQADTSRTMLTLTETPMLEVASSPTEAATQIAFAPPAENPAPPANAEPTPLATPPLRYLEIGLALLALALGLAAWRTRR